MEEQPKRRPDYSDSRRTNNGRGEVRIGQWEDETEKGPHFGIQLKYSYRSKDGNWKKLEHPLADQMLDTAKILLDADSWRQKRLQERRADQAKAKAQASEDEQDVEFDL